MTGFSQQRQRRRHPSSANLRKGANSHVQSTRPEADSGQKRAWSLTSPHTAHWSAHDMRPVHQQQERMPSLPNDPQHAAEKHSYEEKAMPQITVSSMHASSEVVQRKVYPGASLTRAQHGQRGRASGQQTGLPEGIQQGAEQLSGLSLNDVRVHFHSPKPAEVQALAYTQGTDIHVGPGQEQHLAHEVWHVVQQKQGRVKPTLQMKQATINDDHRLEQEADVMGKHLTHQRMMTAGDQASHTMPAMESRPEHLSMHGPVLQRKLSIAGQERDPKDADTQTEILAVAGATVDTVAYLTQMAEDTANTYTYADWVTAIKQTNVNWELRKKFRGLKIRGNDKLFDKNLSTITKLREKKPQSETLNALTDEEAVALKGYTSQDYEMINPFLRGAESVTLRIEGKTQKLTQQDLAPKLQPYIDMVGSGLDKLPVYTGTRAIYRVTNLPQTTIETIENSWNKTTSSWNTPAEISDPAFQSATLSLRTIKNGMGGRSAPHLLIISSQKSGKEVSDVSSHENEREVLFPRQTTWVVDSFEKCGRTNPYYPTCKYVFRVHEK